MTLGRTYRERVVILRPHVDHGAEEAAVDHPCDEGGIVGGLSCWLGELIDNAAA